MGGVWVCGPGRGRTGDLSDANGTRYQLRHRPKVRGCTGFEPVPPSFPAAVRAAMLPGYTNSPFRASRTRSVGMTGVEPAASWSQTRRATCCATSRSTNRAHARSAWSSLLLPRLRLAVAGDSCHEVPPPGQALGPDPLLLRQARRRPSLGPAVLARSRNAAAAAHTLELVHRVGPFLCRGLVPRSMLRARPGIRTPILRYLRPTPLPVGPGGHGDTRRHSGAGGCREARSARADGGTRTRHLRLGKPTCSLVHLVRKGIPPRR